MAGCGWGAGEWWSDFGDRSTELCELPLRRCLCPPLPSILWSGNGSLPFDGLDDLLFDMYKKQVLKHLRTKMTPNMGPLCTVGRLVVENGTLKVIWPLSGTSGRQRTSKSSRASSRTTWLVQPILRRAQKRRISTCVLLGVLGAKQLFDLTHHWKMLDQEIKAD